jgi:predicted PurR-regulated permease PerM
VLVAVLLRALADPIARATRLPDALAVVAATLGLAAVIGFAAWLFGAEIRAQVGELATRLPEAWRSFEERLGATDFRERLVSRAQDAAPDAGSVVSSLAGIITSFVGGLADLVLIVFGGIYLAAQPGLYRAGILALSPAGRSREVVAETLDASGAALRLWLVGHLVAMAFLFVLTGLGLWAIGVPATLALALLAGLAQFVPLVGPIVAALPALLIALSQGWQIALWTLLLYIAIQQVESNLITPLVISAARSHPVRRSRLWPAVGPAGRAVRHAARGGRVRGCEEALGARGARRAYRRAGRRIKSHRPGEYMAGHATAPRESRTDHPVL